MVTGDNEIRVGTWVKYKGHNRFGRVKQVITSQWNESVYDLTYDRDEKARKWIYYRAKAGEKFYIVDRVTQRGGKYVIEEQKWIGDHTEAVDPSDRRIQTWALAMFNG